MYKKIIRSLIVVIVLGLTINNMEAQQVNIFNNNIINPYSLNPAKAGSDGNKIFLQQRNQWIGVQGAPEYSLLTTEWRLGKSKSAVGLTVSHDKTNVLKNNSAYATYASHFDLNSTQKLSLGMSFGARNNSILFDEVYVQESDDPVLFDYNQSSTNFDANFGLAYQFKALEIQFVALQLLGSKSVFSNSYEQKNLEYEFARHFVASAGYKFDVKENFAITPILQARGVQGFNIQPEGIVKVDYKDLVWAAAHYNHNRSYAFTVGVAVSDMFVIGYSAEFASNDFVNYNGGTHEIVFGIKLGKPFQPDINKRELEKLEKTTRGYDERIEYLKRENDRLRKEMDDQKDKLEELKENGGNASYDEIKKILDEIKNTSKKQEEKAVEKEVKKQEEAKEIMKSKASNIQFEKGNAVIKSTSYESLDEIVKVMKENPEAKIAIKGHTDNTGNPAKNVSLSQKRADAVKNYLESKGVNAESVTAKGMGSSEPIKDNATKDGQEANRRVEVEIIF